MIEHASDVCPNCPQGHEERPKQGKGGGLVRDDLSRFCCPNAACAAYGKRGGKNLTGCMGYGAGTHLRLLYCRLCHARFSERKGTPLFQARLPAAQVESVLAHSVEGCGGRKTGRLVGVNRETVARYAVLAGTPAQARHDALGAVAPADARRAVRRKGGLRGQERKALRP